MDNWRLLVVVPFLLTAGHASAASWYDGKSAKCASNLSTAFISNSALAALAAPFDRTSFAGVAPGTRLVYRLASSDLKDGKAKYRAKVLLLDPKLRDQFKRSISAAADKNALPVIEKLTDVFLIVAPELVAFAWPLIFDEAAKQLGATGIPVEGIFPLLAAGGQVVRDTVIQRNAMNEMWATVVWNYVVHVGDEDRTVVLASCLMPVEAGPTEFETKDGFNPKRVSVDADGKWLIFDIDNNKYDDIHLISAGQDAEFIYANELLDGKIWTQHRFSIASEGWQTLSASGKWKYLYKVIDYK